MAVLAGAPWAVRAGIGTALLAAYAWLVVSVGRHLPRGLRRPSRDALRDLPRRLLVRLGLIALVALTPARHVLRPQGGADLAAGVLVLVLRAGFIAVVFGGLARALAAAFRRGRPG
ncbi:MAG: hypothetical protein R2731_18870 [Nocardioides sp.]